eukprot:2682627-Pyramimonas_sp.AAC.1
MCLFAASKGLRRDLGAVGAPHERNLGIDFARGLRFERGVRRVRRAEARRRLRRMGIIRTGAKKRVATKRVARAGLEASMSFGWR